MDATIVVLVMLLAVVASGAISKALPFPIPLPLVQIVLGIAIALGGELRVTLDPEVFFLLFIPPLLFLDGWRIPKQGLFRDLRTVLQLAFGLVLFTVSGIGVLIHWMIPTVPLAVACALAAILAPTDPIAVSAITSRAPIPKRLMHILEGESLLNDASGLVCMRFALAAALTGTFSFSAAIPTFIWVAGGGIAVGAAFTWAITTATNAFAKRFGQETGAEILVSILIPFGAYLVAEQLHCSGILAAVAAGVSMSYVELSGKARGETRMQRAAVWNTAQFAAKGAIFVLLGEQLPAALSNAATAANQAGHDQVWLLGLYVVAITASLTGLRFLWVWASLQFTLYQAGRRGQQPQAPSWRLIAAMSLAGVRGAITLAGVLTFPLAMRDGSPFPARELVVLLAAGTIILSLIVASVGLPRLLVDLPLPPEDTYEEEERLRAAAAEAAIRAVETAQHRMADGRTDADLYAAAAAELMEQYRTRSEERIDRKNATAVSGQQDSIRKQLRLAALKAERAEIFRQARNRATDDQIARKLVRELDLLEARLVR